MLSRVDVNLIQRATINFAYVDCEMGQYFFCVRFKINCTPVTPSLTVMAILKIATTTSNAGPFAKAPLEVMEMIFGRLNFPDLASFVRVSKWTRVPRLSMCALADL